MTRKIQALQVEQFGQPLVQRELDIPTSGTGQILVKTKTCGVCNTDLHAAGGDWPLKPALLFIPGLEGINAVFERLAKGEVPSRGVQDFASLIPTFPYRRATPPCMPIGITILMR